MTQDQINVKKEQLKALFVVMYNHEKEKGLNKMLSRNKLQAILFKGVEIDKQEQFAIITDLISTLVKVQYIREYQQVAGKQKIKYYGCTNLGRKNYEDSLKDVESVKPF